MDIKSQNTLDQLMAQIRMIQDSLEGNRLGEGALLMEAEELGGILKRWGGEVLQGDTQLQMPENVMETVEELHGFFISLYNKHDQLDISLRLMNTLGAVFQGKGVLSERFEKDLSALENEKNKRSVIRESVLISQKERAKRTAAHKAGGGNLLTRGGIFLLAIILMSFFYFEGGYGSAHGSLQKKLTFHEPVQPKPENGFVKYYTEEKAIAPFSIKTPVGGGYFYILLREVSTNKAVVSIFMYPDSTKDIKIPVGDYIMYYAEGQKWYGTEHLFGPETKLLKGRDVLSFYIKGDTIEGLKVMLETVPDGNLKSEEAEPEEFKIE